MKKIILKPVISEKTYNLAQEGVYTFVVNKNANKIEIKKAVEKQFKVTVIKVNTINIPGKRVRFGRMRKLGRRSDIKKALITLKEGDKIALFET